INLDWIRRYDWILAKVLLDDSFADDLEAVVRQVDEDPVSKDDHDLFAAGAKNVTTAVTDYKAYTGGDALTFIGAAQDAYQKLVEKQMAQRTTAKERSARFIRLQQHLRDNIFYYMRAIWGAEDADQRLRRYARISVPTLWTFVPFDSNNLPAEGGSFATGEFVPDMSEDSVRPVTELINPAGPIGYAGNYAVFYLKSEVGRH